MLEDMNAKLLAIHVAKATKLSMDSRQSIEAITDAGLEGDRYEKQGSRGQVTLQSAEQLAEAAEILGSTIEPGATRRNLTLSGVELRPEPGQRLHRLDRDPGERSNLREAHAQRASELARRLEEHLESSRAARGAPNRRHVLGEEQVETLRQLGYVE